MKRFGAVASLLLVAAIGVGAFVYAGSDNGNGHKSGANVVKNDSVQHDSNTTVTTAKKDEPKTTTSNSVASETPIPKPASDDAVFHVGDDEQPELDGYEARRVFVGVSPSVTVTGKTIQIEVRGFHAGESVNVYFDPAPVPGNGKSNSVVPPNPGSVVVNIPTDQRGRGKVKFIVTQTPGRWVVSAIGTVKDAKNRVRSSATILKVVLKK
jgi:hypothetical protein